VIGARGFVGRELIGLLDHHPALQLSIAASSSQAGEGVRDMLGAGPDELKFSDISPDSIVHDCPDVLVLALPNGGAQSFVDAIQTTNTAPRLILDLSADMRFTPNWTYAVPELHAHRLPGSRRIANPGCYATAMQLALTPVMRFATDTPHCFGVSGYSGAGAKPSPRNDPAALEGGVLPYALAGHIHEQEVSEHLGRRVRFSPTVAPFFRGIVLTAQFDVPDGTTTAQISKQYEEAYAEHPLVQILGETMPRVQDVAHTPAAQIGGITIDPCCPTHAGVVCVIDNLLKGAASQAIQNINLALNLPPLLGFEQ
jgi:N-acetyl-gamma-glutamyl-phosphate reductase